MNILEGIISCLQSVCKQEQRVHSSKKLLSENNLFSSEHVYLAVRGMGTFNWQMFVLCFETVVWKGNVLVVSRVIIPSVACVNAAFSSGLCKEGMQWLFCATCTWGRSYKRCLHFREHPGCVCPACRASPTHLHSLQAAEGGGSWAQTALGVLWTLSTRTELSLLQLMLNMAIFYQKSLSIVF